VRLSCGSAQRPDQRMLSSTRTNHQNSHFSQRFLYPSRLPINGDQNRDVRTPHSNQTHFTFSAKTLDSDKS
jgi:hypothetical protein